ncbi:MAG: succinate dehydrogenase, cytochrome b556 subunit [Gammaproteobacteria bacterium]|nr:succinate dehydrogenase, cytochrome b556 subunit [Gammaproteobacteria bacterium]
MQDQRPVFLNLVQFRFPIAAIMSVGHRASGLFLVLLIPIVVYLLDLSLSGSDGFDQARAILTSLPAKLALFIALWALMHHLLAGIRFLLIDIDIGVDKLPARKSATIVMVAAPLLALILESLL